MKPGDEITVGGKVYVAGDIKLLRLMLCGNSEDNWREVCDYCTDACQIERRDCIRKHYRAEILDHSLENCKLDPMYFFLKPEHSVTGEQTNDNQIP